MKLLQALREKIYEEQAKIADSFAKAVGFNGIHDTNTVIERKMLNMHGNSLYKINKCLLIAFQKKTLRN